MRTPYVLGFMFDERKEHFLAIRKTKPKWQAGKLNGVGGKNEKGETPFEAMRREFREETSIDCDAWKQVALMEGPDFKMYIFSAVGDIGKAVSVTEEEVGAVSVTHLPAMVIPNLRYLVPMALLSQTEKQFFPLYITV